MISPLLISLAVFVGVAALVGAVAMLIRENAEGKVEDRLELFAASQHPAAREKRVAESLLAEQPGNSESLFEQIFKRLGSLQLLFEQADTSLSPSTFALVTLVMGGVGWVAAWASGCPLGLYPALAVVMGALPTMWLLFRRQQRFKKFAAQLPDALELISRALRAGHSLAAGMDLVQQEMMPPVGKEFGRAFDEQNLGVSMDEALRAMTERVPNLDLKFFVTAVILQRQTGGDLAEILDKIGHLIRERFRIWGQVQALTGEGRLSGVVLLGLPPVLFLAVWRLNPDYVMLLFEDPMGKKMLAGAIVLQVLGAAVIRKIVNIKV